MVLPFLIVIEETLNEPPSVFTVFGLLDVAFEVFAQAASRVAIMATKMMLTSFFTGSNLFSSHGTRPGSLNEGETHYLACHNCIISSKSLLFFIDQLKSSK